MGGQRDRLVRANEAEPLLDESESVKQKRGNIVLVLLLQEPLCFQERVMRALHLDRPWKRGDRHSHHLSCVRCSNAGPLERPIIRDVGMISNAPRRDYVSSVVDLK